MTGARTSLRDTGPRCPGWRGRSRFPNASEGRPPGCALFALAGVAWIALALLIRTIT